jgi:hypothetical protein
MLRLTAFCQLTDGGFDRLLNSGRILRAFQVEISVNRDRKAFPPKRDGGEIGSEIVVSF